MAQPDRRPSRPSRSGRTRPGAPGGRRPGSGPTGTGARRTARTGSLPVVAAETESGPGEASRPKPPRLTGRAALLILIVVVLAVSYASSLRAYLHQREHIADLKAEIASSSTQIDGLERQRDRWGDDSFVEQQARKRLGYVRPGESSYQAIEGDGEPVDAGSDLADPDSAAPLTPPPWWDAAWRSVERAGDPPTKRDKPASVLPDDTAETP